MAVCAAAASSTGPSRVSTALFQTTSPGLIAAVAAQVWLGILMLWDTHDGPAQRFNA